MPRKRDQEETNEVLTGEDEEEEEQKNASKIPLKQVFAIRLSSSPLSCRDACRIKYPQH